MAPAKKKPESKPRKVRLWIVLVVALIAMAGATAYLTSRSNPEAESATTTESEPALFSSRHLYSEAADPNADIAAALKKASLEHKRVIVDLGGDWCIDCQVLDIYFHQPPNDEILQKNFVLVHVWIGHLDQHLDIPARYGMPVDKVPALAVLAPNGDVVYAQRSGEFDRMREMKPATVTEFLNTWKS
jgi:thiol:disulfide interchange protein